ncbi:MAG: PIG-L family deacetylase [Firmicutes bacterium]|nr:PIG-L family deacetylase [Bacillota bacterium]
MKSFQRARKPAKPVELYKCTIGSRRMYRESAPGETSAESAQGRGIPSKGVLRKGPPSKGAPRAIRITIVGVALLLLLYVHIFGSPVSHARVISEPASAQAVAQGSSGSIGSSGSSGLNGPSGPGRSSVPSGSGGSGGLNGSNGFSGGFNGFSGFNGFKSISPSSGDRILVIAPHSDDETLGAGGFLYDAVRCGATAYVVLMTNGDGFPLAADREFHTLRATSMRFIELGYKRQGESLEALRTLGVPEKNVFFLGYPDKGLALMWHEHWSASSPYLSRFTRTFKSPYFNSYRPDTFYSGEDVVRDLKDIILKVRPTIILTASPVDMHPDHWATYNFTLYTVEYLDQKGLLPAPRPRVLWYLVHRGEWPYPKGFRPGAWLLPPKGLYPAGFNWFLYPLSSRAVVSKGEAIRMYRSQVSIMARYLLSFARANELFAEATVVPVPNIPWPGPLVDGRLDDWPADIRPMEEPVKDSMVRKVEGGGDFAGMLVGKDGTNLYLALNLRTRASREILYRLHLHSVGIYGHEGPEGDIDFTFRPDKRGAVSIVAPTHKDARFEEIKAASWDKTIEMAIPLRLLGNPQRLFLGVESRFQGIMIDRTTWWVLKL